MRISLNQVFKGKDEPGQEPGLLLIFQSIPFSNMYISKLKNVHIILIFMSVTKAVS